MSVGICRDVYACELANECNSHVYLDGEVLRHRLLSGVLTFNVIISLSDHGRDSPR